MTGRSGFEDPAMTDPSLVPVEVRMHRKSRLLELVYENGESVNLAAEYLRVYSPSAEVQGHGPGQAVLIVGKERVNVKEIEPVGHYAIRIRFDDGHDSGLFSWQYLRELSDKEAENWEAYRRRCEEAGYKRKAPEAPA
jgi:DUF971 family protein